MTNGRLTVGCHIRLLVAIQELARKMARSGTLNPKEFGFFTDITSLVFETYIGNHP